MDGASFDTFNRSQHTCTPMSSHAAVSFPEIPVLCALLALSSHIDDAELPTREGVPGSLSTVGVQAEEMYKPR